MLYGLVHIATSMCALYIMNFPGVVRLALPRLGEEGARLYMIIKNIESTSVQWIILHGPRCKCFALAKERPWEREGHGGFLALSHLTVELRFKQRLVTGLCSTAHVHL